MLSYKQDKQDEGLFLHKIYQPLCYHRISSRLGIPEGSSYYLSLV